ncbi:MAG: hypothetical protein ACFFCS_23325 [Candidatus Hodarchaeota archaeon]
METGVFKQKFQKFRGPRWLKCIANPINLVPRKPSGTYRRDGGKLRPWRPRETSHHDGKADEGGSPTFNCFKSG